MKELPKEFIGRGEMRGFHFTLLDATDKAYLYKVDMNGAIWLFWFVLCHRFRSGLCH